MSNAFQLNDYNSFVLRIGEVLNTSVIIKALYDISVDQWDRSINSDTQEHLIEGVFTSSQKSDAVKIYVTKLMRTYMASRGNRLSAWTKETIGGENATNVAITNRISATEFKNNTELFMLVAGRLMGYDDALLEFAITDPVLVDRRVELLMEYVSGQYDLGDPDRMVKDLYIDAFDILKELLGTNGYTPEYVRKHAQAVLFFVIETVAGGNHWDTFVSLHLKFQENDLAGLELIPYDQIVKDTTGYIEKMDPSDKGIDNALSATQVVDALRGSTVSLKMDVIHINEKGTSLINEILVKSIPDVPDDLPNGISFSLDKDGNRVVTFTIDATDPDPKSTIEAISKEFFSLFNALPEVQDDTIELPDTDLDKA